MPRLVTIDEALRLRTVTGDQLDGQLELVAGARRPGGLNSEGVTELTDVGLRIRPFGRLGVLPAVCEGRERSLGGLRA